LADHEGPTSILKGGVSEEIIKKAADITAYHTKFRDAGQLKISYRKAGAPGPETILADAPEKDIIEGLRIN